MGIICSKARTILSRWVPIPVLSLGNLTCSYVKNDKAEKGNILKMGKTEDVRRDREVS
jgi:hypothetical protein